MKNNSIFWLLFLNKTLLMTYGAYKYNPQRGSYIERFHWSDQTLIIFLLIVWCNEQYITDAVHIKMNVEFFSSMSELKLCRL